MAGLSQSPLAEAVALIVNPGTSRFGDLLYEQIAAECQSTLMVTNGGADTAGEGLTGALAFTSGDVNVQIRRIEEKYGRIDLFIYLLPESEADSLENFSAAAWDRTRLQARQMFWYYRSVGKHMAKKRYGSMIGVHFGVNARGDAEMLSWTIFGEMLVGMSKCLAVELLKQNVRINMIAYGYMDQVTYPDSAHRIIDDYRKYLGILRKGTVGDVAGVIRLLGSDTGNYITGQTVYVNGGLII